MSLFIWEFGAVKETSFNFFSHIFDRNAFGKTDLFYDSMGLCGNFT